MSNPNAKSLKILIIGGPEVGKTSLLRSYNGQDFQPTYSPTVNSDFSVKTVLIGDVELSVQLWDIGATATMGKAFFRGTQGILMVVDVSTPTSHSQLKDLYDKVASLSNFADNRFPCVLVGNKVDKGVESRFVSSERLQSFADTCRYGDDAAESPIRVFEASALSGINVVESFRSIIEKTHASPARTLSAAAVAVLSARQEEQGTSSDAGYYDGLMSRRLTSDGTTAKVIIAGAAAVGKTMILQRYCSGPKHTLSQIYEPTVGADFRLVNVPAKNSELKLQIWDSAGDIKQQKLSRALFKGSHCLILVFDITSKESFLALDNYWTNFIEFSDTTDPDDFPAVLVGNKSDLSDRRAVQMEQILDWCANKRPRKPVTYIECSALRNITVGDIFVVAGDYIYDLLNVFVGEEDDADMDQDGENAEDDEQTIARAPEDGLDMDNDDEETNAGKYSETPTDPRAEPARHGNALSESNYAAGAPDRLRHGAQKNLQNQQTTCFDFPAMIKRMFCS